MPEIVDPQFYSLVENSSECNIMIDVGILTEEYDCLKNNS
ncbi:hypothetical protein HMPREF0105_2559 [Bacteroides sp. 3_1_33FAA]|uniref:Uncharacterized protein n=1 Tax=Phocaeicola dorei DSM 17855 TaxID=483217 RepID=B6VZE0_9BACT|nr:hypothetical protein BACDOR_02647 [Phocaeicola dorei DSM 17855]EEZ20776.1 hypothetical protein HMPREF0105_2559 [Bacteroides sp. 3_1_33FAA]